VYTCVNLKKSSKVAGTVSGAVGEMWFCKPNLNRKHFWGLVVKNYTQIIRFAFPSACCYLAVVGGLASYDDPENCAGKGPTKPEWSTVSRQTKISAWSSKFGGCALGQRPNHRKQSQLQKPTQTTSEEESRLGTTPGTQSDSVPQLTTAAESLWDHVWNIGSHTTGQHDGWI